MLHCTAKLLTKLSVVLLYLCIFKERKLHLSFMATGVVTVLWWLADILALTLNCMPPESIWNPSISGHCGRWNLLWTAAFIPWIATDIALLLLPLPSVWKFQMPFAERIGVIGILMLGGLFVFLDMLRQVYTLTIHYLVLQCRVASALRL